MTGNLPFDERPLMMDAYSERSDSPCSPLKPSPQSKKPCAPRPWYRVTREFWILCKYLTVPKITGNTGKPAECFAVMLASLRFSCSHAALIIGKYGGIRNAGWFGLSGSSPACFAYLLYFAYFSGSCDSDFNWNWQTLFTKFSVFFSSLKSAS